MSNSALLTQFRQKALDTLQESSALFEAALVLSLDGKDDDAKQMQKLARQKRYESSCLMAEALKIESDLPAEASIAQTA